MIKCRACGSNQLSEPTCFGEWPKSAQKFGLNREDSLKARCTLEVVECLGCTHVQLKGNPVEYYQEVIRSAKVSEEMQDFRRKQFKKIAENHLGLNLRDLVAFEVGSGAGEYAEILSGLGSHVFALDISDKQSMNKKVDSITQIQGYPDQIHFHRIRMQIGSEQKKRINLLYSFNFIEHWPEPISSLKLLAELMPNDCTYLLEVPNSEMIVNEGLFSELIPDHLSYFTYTSFATLLSNAGLEIISIDRIYNDYILSALCKKSNATRGHVLKRLKIKHEEGVREFSEFVNQSEIPLIIWGASHQTLVYLASIPMNEKIDCVVDNAEFKQNRYMIGSDYYIYPTSHLASKSPARLLVSCGGYTSEVLRYASRELKDGWKIYYFGDSGEIKEFNKKDYL